MLLDRYEARGTDKSMATYYGIFTIPQMVLVGKDGRVLSVDVRGQRLNKAWRSSSGRQRRKWEERCCTAEQSAR